jgi:hypothetical protein
LRALVAGRGSPYRTAVLARLDLPKASAQQALKTLRARSDVEAADGAYAIVDPLLALWIDRLAGGEATD